MERAGGGGHAFDDALLEGGMVPFGEVVMLADAQGGIAGGGSAGFGGAGVKGVGDEVAVGGGNGLVDESFGVAGKDGGESGPGFNAGFAEGVDGGEAFGMRGAEGFVEAADFFAIGGEGEADAQGGEAGEFLE